MTVSSQCSPNAPNFSCFLHISVNVILHQLINKSECNYENQKLKEQND